MNIAISAGLSTTFDPLAFARRKAEDENNAPGDLTGYNCPDCLNRGYTTDVDDAGSLMYQQCRCMEVRQSLRNIELSGLAGVIDRWTFDAFHATESWQKSLKSGAEQFVQAVRAGGESWFFVSGQPGCGKSHICTAISGELMRSGLAMKYMVWPEEAGKIKASRNDPEKQAELLEPLKTVDVLYIDDLLKVARSNDGWRHDPDRPTDADIRLCFEIINARYLRGKTTVFSSEMSLTDELMDMDGATFSRVYQRATAPTGFVFSIAHAAGRNHRLRGAGGSVE